MWTIFRWYHPKFVFTIPSNVSLSKYVSQFKDKPALDILWVPYFTHTRSYFRVPGELNYFCVDTIGDENFVQYYSYFSSDITSYETYVEGTKRLP